jgi:hemerythrin-like domain-containing protein
VSLPPPEDLYREHAVVRRLLLVYSFFVRRLRLDEKVDLAMVVKAAKLFDRFGSYHASSEERFVFPVFRKTNVAAVTRGFIRDHREVTSLTKQILTVARRQAPNRQELADLMDAVVQLYRAHATHEDLAIIARLREVLTAEQMSRLADRMEAFEHKTLGRHGFEDAMIALGEIERPLKINTRALYA